MATAAVYLAIAAVASATASVYGAVQTKKAADDKIDQEKFAHSNRELKRTTRALEIAGAQVAAAARSGIGTTSGSIVRIQEESDRRVRADQAFDNVNTEFAIGALRREGRTALIVGSLSAAGALAASAAVSAGAAAPTTAATTGGAAATVAPAAAPAAIAPATGTAGTAFAKSGPISRGLKLRNFRAVA